MTESRAKQVLLVAAICGVIIFLFLLPTGVRLFREARAVSMSPATRPNVSPATVPPPSAQEAPMSSASAPAQPSAESERDEAADRAPMMQKSYRLAPRRSEETQRIDEIRFRAYEKYRAMMEDLEKDRIKRENEIAKRPLAERARLRQQLATEIAQKRAALDQQFEEALKNADHKTKGRIGTATTGEAKTGTTP